MSNILNLIKNENESGPLVSQKAIFLTKKWNENIKKYKEKDKFAGIIYNFSEIKKMGIKIPSSGYNCFTYDHYISEVDENFNDNNNDNKIIYPNYDQMYNNRDINNYGQYQYNKGSAPMGDFMNVQKNENGVNKDFNNNDFNLNNFSNRNGDNFNNEVMTPFGNNKSMNRNINSIYNIDNNINNNNNNNYNGKEYFNNINNNNNFNNNQNNIQNNIYFNSNDPMLYKNTWTTRLNIYNKWIDEGKSGYNYNKLKEGIENILNEFDKIENMIRENNNNTKDILMEIKSDMDQTCLRYENLIKDKKIEGYKSAFDGNTKKYNFIKENLFNNNDNKEENKYLKRIKTFGDTMKKGFYSVENSVVNAGKTIKESTIKGYNYVKEKINKNEDKEKENKDNKDNMNKNLNEQNNQSGNIYNNNINNNRNIQNYNNNFNNQNYENNNNNNNQNCNNNYNNYINQNYNNQNYNYQNYNNQNCNNNYNNYNNINQNYNNQNNNNYNNNYRINNQNNNYNNQNNKNSNNQNYNNNFNNQNYNNNFNNRNDNNNNFNNNYRNDYNYQNYNHFNQNNYNEQNNYNNIHYQNNNFNNSNFNNYNNNY